MEQHEGDGYEDGRDNDHGSILTKGCNEVGWTDELRHREKSKNASDAKVGRRA